jgi:hypothetical protein
VGGTPITRPTQHQQSIYRHNPYTHSYQ